MDQCWQRPVIKLLVLIRFSLTEGSPQPSSLAGRPEGAAGRGWREPWWDMGWRHSSAADTADGGKGLVATTSS